MTATLADVAEVTGRYTNVSGPAGIPWTRDTVTNLENGRRTRLAVHELLALAYVLGLATPADLLMPKTAPRIPVTPVTEAATLDARAWCWGQIGPLRDWLAAEPSEREASAALVQDGRGRGPGGSEQAGGGAGRQRWPQLRTLGRTDGKSFVAAKTAELAPTTVETAYAVLRALGSAAVEDGVIPANPFARVRLPTVPDRSRAFPERSPSVPRAFPERSPSVPQAFPERSPSVLPLEPAAVLALADAIRPRLRVAVAIGAGAGLRFGEGGRAHRGAGGLPAPPGARAGAGAARRAGPAEDQSLPAGRPGRRMAAGRGQRRPAALRARCPGGVIMSNAVGRIVARNAFGDAWRPAVKAAGLPAGTRYHDLRHFHASALIAANLNPKVVQAQLGHATIAETTDTYGHLFPDSEDLGRGAVDDALGSAQPEQGRNRDAR